MTNVSLSQNDQALIELLRGRPAMTVGKLVGPMGVTATAVRQRLSRLMALGLVERSQTVEGRGRPSHYYSLTAEGHETAGNNLSDLAVVLWQEVHQIADLEMRQRVISGVTDRLAEKYKSAANGHTVEDRMKSISRLFADRQIPITVENRNGLPVITVSDCPYPSLANDNRDICAMEQRLLEKIVGQRLDLCQCQQDGDQCCSFQAAKNDTQL